MIHGNTDRKLETSRLADVILSCRCWVFFLVRRFQSVETRTVQVNRDRQIPSNFFETVTQDMIQKTWQEIEFCLDVFRATNGAHIEMY
jgi:hypothetical protein